MADFALAYADQTEKHHESLDGAMKFVQIAAEREFQDQESDASQIDLVPFSQQGA